MLRRRGPCSALLEAREQAAFLFPAEELLQRLSHIDHRLPGLAKLVFHTRCNSFHTLPFLIRRLLYGSDVQYYLSPADVRNCGGGIHGDVGTLNRPGYSRGFPAWERGRNHGQEAIRSRPFPIRSEPALRPIQGRRPLNSLSDSASSTARSLACYHPRSSRSRSRRARPPESALDRRCDP